MSPTYLKTREAFTGNGKAATQINANNTAIHHIATMYDHAGESFTSAGITGVAAGKLGDQNARNLKTDSQAIGTELAKSYVSGGQTTQDEIKNWKDLVDPTSALMTTGKIQGNLKEIVNLLEGKLDATQTQWDTGMPQGAVTPRFAKQGGIISDESRQILDNINQGRKAFFGLPVPDGSKTQAQISQERGSLGTQATQVPQAAQTPQAAPQAQAPQVTPSSHTFSPSGWAKANPKGDVAAATAQAKASGYQVGQ
jgi:hypothetical protein